MKYNNNKNDNNDNINKTDKIFSKEGFECIGPCYPPNTFYYNPINLSLIKNPYPSCPIKERTIKNNDGTTYKKYSGECNEDDINKQNKYFDIFSDYIQIATNSKNFLSDIYNLNNISDIIHFISNEYDNIPIYSQRRLLNAIFYTYYNYIEFPKLLFVKKLLIVLKNIYKITNLNEDKIFEKLNNSTNTEDLYSLFYKI